MRVSRQGRVRSRAEAPILPARPPAPVDHPLRLQVQAGNRAVTALVDRPAAAGPPLLWAGDALALQRSAGNQAVGSLVAVQPQAQTPPADVNVGFNAMDIMHRLLIAIDKERFDIRTMTRHVDFPAVVAALSNLTAAEAKQAEAAYLEHENRTLYNDLFGAGGSGHPSDLVLEQVVRIDALLGGTRAGSPEEALVAAAHRSEADAAELHALLHGDLEAGEVERAMVLLRRSATANQQLAAVYGRITHDTLQGDLGRLGPVRFIRALFLFNGDAARADSCQVHQEQARIAAIDARAAAIHEDMNSFVGAGPAAFIEIHELQEERKHLVATIEGRLQGISVEARDAALGEGGSAAQADEAARGRLGAVVGDVGALASTVGGTDASVIRGVAAGDPVAVTAARLRRLAEAGDLGGEQLTTALRRLRQEAEAQAARELRGAPPDEVAARASAVADGYFARLRPAYDELAGDRKHFDDVVAGAGDEGDVRVNESLLRGGGRLEDIDELVLALNGDRKDIATVERVLRDKPIEEIRRLSAAYRDRTGKVLEKELFGEAPTAAGIENPELMGQHLLEQGKAASGTERLNLEDYLQRPDREGGIEEVSYIAARGEREYTYTIENRGATGWWRDTWGNEQRQLLDETIQKIRGLVVRYRAAALVRPEWAHSPEAHRIVLDLRLARATIRGDRAAYEKATAELRATFQAVAAFALQVALTAVLGPIAEVALIGEIGEGASVALRVAKLAQGAAVGTASTIGANLAAYGSDYSLAMLKADLLGGMGGAIGPAAVDRLVGPYAKALAGKIGPQLSGEILELGKNAASMETAAWAQGKSADISVEGLAKARLSKALTDRIQGGLAPAAETPAGGPEVVPAEGKAVEPAAPEPGAAPVEPRALEPESAIEPAAPGAPGDEFAVEPTKVEPTAAGTVLQPDDPHDLVGGFKLYKRQIAADPTREVALLYNHATDEWAVVQGERGMVPTIEGMRRLGWEVKETTVGRHSHSIGRGGQTSEANQLASGRGGDVDMVRADSFKREPVGVQWHAIDVTLEGGRPDRTWVFYSRETGLWTVDYPDAGERGGRGRVSFSSVEQYEGWFEARFDTSPSPARRAPAAPDEAVEPHSPGDDLERAKLIMESLADMAAGDTGLMDVEAGEEHILDRPEYQQGIQEASDAFASLPNIEQRKNLARTPRGEIERSGYGGEGAEATDRVRVASAEYGHDTEAHRFDRGEEGQYECSHSERKKAETTGGQTFASSKVMCPACQGFFGRRARVRGDQFVADPMGVHVFTRNGSHIVADHPSGAVTMDPRRRARLMER
jgi:hypothetical protein